MSVSITGVAPDFIINRLENDSVIIGLSPRGIHNIEIPQAETQEEADARFPGLLVKVPFWDPNAKGNGNHIIWSRGFYPIVAVGFLYQIAKLEEFAAEFRRIFHGYFGAPPTGGYINSCDLIRPVFETDRLGDLTILRIGSLFRISARLSSS